MLLALSQASEHRLVWARWKQIILQFDWEKCSAFCVEAVLLNLVLWFLLVLMQILSFILNADILIHASILIITVLVFLL